MHNQTICTRKRFCAQLQYKVLVHARNCSTTLRNLFKITIRLLVKTMTRQTDGHIYHLCTPTYSGDQCCSSCDLSSSSGTLGLCVDSIFTMSSVAVLTQERFNEHRGGLLTEQSGGGRYHRLHLNQSINQPNFIYLTRFVQNGDTKGGLGEFGIWSMS